jgi:hypothetical protein
MCTPTDSEISIQEFNTQTLTIDYIDNVSLTTILSQNYRNEVVIFFIWQLKYLNIGCTIKMKNMTPILSILLEENTEENTENNM